MLIFFIFFDLQFGQIVFPGAGGFLIAGPIGAGVGAGASGLVAVDYQRKLAKRIRELVDQHSKKDLTLDKIESFS
jgi:hypothetical protein